MKKVYYLPLALLLCQGAFGQSKSLPCNCPKSGYGARAVATFDLDGNRKISICGYREKSRKDTVFSGFLLFQCGRKEFISEWDETQSCKITQNADTLLVSEFSALPVGKGFALKSVLFRVKKFFFQNASVVSTASYLSSAPGYSSAQINTVLQQYTKLSGRNYDSILLVAHRLVWAYISGSSKAEKYLQQMKTKFGPFDGAIAEEFEEVCATYELWKKENGGR